MSFFYVVKGIGGGFDGLVIEGVPLKDLPETVSVKRIIDNANNVGDRTASLPIPTGAITIAREFLDPTDDPGMREFASDNPFGKLILEGHMTCGDLKVSYSQFESVLSVNVSDSVRTVFSQYFSKDFDKVKSTVESVLKKSIDADDLVFALRALKEAEANGQR